MRKNQTARCAAVCCALLMLLSFASCASPGTGTPAPTAEPPQPPAPTAAPEPEGEVPTPAPEPTAAQEPSAEGTHFGTLPAPEAGDKAFHEAFAENPIDAQYVNDIALASSVAQMVEACSTASQRWQDQIASVYAQLTADGVETSVTERISAEQTLWLEAQDDALTELRDAVDETDTSAPLEVAESIMLYYRTRAIDLCAELFERTGVLSFG